MQIPLVDLKSEYFSHQEEIDRAISSVLKSGIFIRGPQLKLFEENVAQFVGVQHAVGVASGTDALVLILHALGIQHGDEVIVPAFTFYATAEAVLRLGANPVLCDVDDETGLMKPADVAAKITKRTKAIIPVHLFGQPADMDGFQKLSEDAKVILIEDCAQALGASFQNRMCASFGKASGVSFYPSKNLGGYGDGGMVLTNDKKLADKIRLLGNHGSLKKDSYKMIGYNSRLDEIQAAVLNVKIKTLKKNNARRRKKAALYRRELALLSPYIRPLTELPERNHIYHMFVVRAKKRNKLLAYLRKMGILAQVHYTQPLHLNPVFKQYGFKKGDFPKAEELSRSVLSLPLFPNISPEQIKVVCQRIARFYS